MLASSSEYSFTTQSIGDYIHAAPNRSDERPKLYAVENGSYSDTLSIHSGYAYNTQPNGMHFTPNAVDHEPLMLSMQHQNYQNLTLGSSMVSFINDYPSGTPMSSTASSISTPISRGNFSKRSREELNMKEKRRMFKLNDRINHLKAILDEAGVQSKKNKQSILDNTYHYIEMLRNYLSIAREKTERAEKLAETYKQQHMKRNDGDGIERRCFERSTTPKVLIGLDHFVKKFNSAFLAHTGLCSDWIQDKHSVQPFLCMDAPYLDRLIHKVTQSKVAASAFTQVQSGNGVITVNLIASPVNDENGQPECIEFSIILIENSSGAQNGLLSFAKETVQESPSGVSDFRS